MGMTETVTAKEAEVAKVTRGNLVEDLKAVVADAEELLKASASQTGERIAAVRAKAEESVKAAKARLAGQEAAVMAKARAAAKGADDYVRANPWKGVGISARRLAPSSASWPHGADPGLWPLKRRLPPQAAVHPLQVSFRSRAERRQTCCGPFLSFS